MSYYNPEIPKKTKSRFRNMTFYRKQNYLCLKSKFDWIEAETKDLINKLTDSVNLLDLVDSEKICKREKEDLLNNCFWLIQLIYTLIENNFTSIEIITANKNLLEKMIKIYETKKD